MDIEKAKEVLRVHNEWRRGDDSLDMTDPKELSIAIDTVLQALS